MATFRTNTYKVAYPIEGALTGSYDQTYTVWRNGDASWHVAIDPADDDVNAAVFIDNTGKFTVSSSFATELLASSVASYVTQIA